MSMTEKEEAIAREEAYDDFRLELQKKDMTSQRLGQFMHWCVNYHMRWRQRDYRLGFRKGTHGRFFAVVTTIDGRAIRNLTGQMSIQKLGEWFEVLEKGMSL